MIPIRDADYLTGLVANLRHLPRETEWVEFKINQATKPQDIGEYISALANGATLNGKDSAYMIWGIENNSHEIVGTTFKPATARQGNEPLENWLRHGLTPSLDFRFHEVALDGKRVVILQLEKTRLQPVAFRGYRFIRVGDVKKNLREHPEKERALWRILEQFNFESEIALDKASDDDVLSILNCPAYFDRVSQPLPDGRAAILRTLQNRQLIVNCDAGGWNITNVAAVLFARNLYDFPRIRGKTMRVIQYRGEGRTETQREQEFAQGYAVAFSSIIDYIMTLVPANEVIEQALRSEMPMFPHTSGA